MAGPVVWQGWGWCVHGRPEAGGSGGRSARPVPWASWAPLPDPVASTVLPSPAPHAPSGCSVLAILKGRGYTAAERWMDSWEQAWEVGAPRQGRPARWRRRACYAAGCCLPRRIHGGCVGLCPGGKLAGLAPCWCLSHCTVGNGPLLVLGIIAQQGPPMLTLHPCSHPWCAGQLAALPDGDERLVFGACSLTGRDPGSTRKLSKQRRRRATHGPAHVCTTCTPAALHSL